MPPYINRVMLMGHLGHDPDLRYMPTNGSPVCEFSIATTRTWKDSFYHEKQEGTDWHRIKVWGDFGEMCARYLAKGMLVYVEGRLENRSWIDKQTQKRRYITEIRAARVIIFGVHADPDVQAYLDEASGQVHPPEDFGPTEELAFQNPPCGCSSEHHHSERTGFCMEPDCDACTGVK